ncbi:hypothetical protein B1P88_00840 [Enterococcus faecium]|nr:hypothetical protein B1P88_00840 [Enterococcus faecium]
MFNQLSLDISSKTANSGQTADFTTSDSRCSRSSFYGNKLNTFVTTSFFLEFLGAYFWSPSE